ncbi:MAG: Ig-like domain-containing protein [Leptospirales bacterium]
MSSLFAFYSRSGLSILLVLALCVTGCQENSLSFPPSSGSGGSSSVLSGTAFDGPVLQGTVTLEMFPPGSGVLGTATTGPNGQFSMTVPALDPNTVYLLSVKNGKTIDFASGATINFAQGDQLTALGTGNDFTRGSVSVTLFTTLETSLAKYFLSQGEDAQSALGKSGSLWTGFLGFDPVRTVVDDPTQGPAQATPSGLYGLYLAGFSQLAYNIGESQNLSVGTANTLGLLANLESDLSDGVLNGMALGSASTLRYYGYTLTSDTLRKSLAAGVLEFLWNARNKSGLNPTQITGSANSLALNTSSLFPGSPIPVAPDPGSPTLLIQSPQAAQYYKGSLIISATASDDLGIGSLILSSPDLSLPGGTLSGNPIATSFNTVTQADGPYSLIFTATDYAGNFASQVIPFSIDNTPPVLSSLNPASGTTLPPYCNGTNATVIVTGTLTDNGSGPNYLLTKELSPQATAVNTTMSRVSSTQDSFSFEFIVPSHTTCQTTQYSFTLTGFDNLNNLSTMSYTLSIKN